jgi:hypothetical protein
VQANVVLLHFGHETVDAVAHVRQEHKNVRAVRLSCTPSRLSPNRKLFNTEARGPIL